MDAYICFAEPSHFPSLAHIDHKCFHAGCSVAEFRQFYRRPGARMLVLRCGSDITGYIAWEYHENSVEMHNVCVHPGYRHNGFGGGLLKSMLRTLKDGYRACFADVAESNLNGQKFLSKRGFLACHRILRHEFLCPDGQLEDGYRMLLDMRQWRDRDAQQQEKQHA